MSDYTTKVEDVKLLDVVENPLQRGEFWTVQEIRHHCRDWWRTEEAVPSPALDFVVRLTLIDTARRTMKIDQDYGTSLEVIG